MASITQSPVTFTGASAAASDLLRSSSNGVSGVPLKALGSLRLGTKRRDFTVTAKIRKGKKHEYPWPDNPDPNVKGGVLSHLSPFKSLKEKPKPVTLEFEKPLMDLQKKIIDVKKMANETGLDFSDQISLLETKYLQKEFISSRHSSPVIIFQALKDLYTHLTPIQRVNIARHPNRPTFLDHIFSITDKFVELHGDRAGYDDPAIVTGIGTIDGRRYMFMGHQKGRNTKENIQRNFGMPTPHGYRKAMRMMYYADHHGFPIITFIDTPGAFADLKSEELGQGEAIAHNLRTMFGLKVPIVSIVIGEGGSGGALAIGCANKLLMLENAVFYVASPEACAAILWKSAKASPKAAEKLKITATELCKLQIADGIIPEPLGGAHADPSWTSQQIKKAINESMDELMTMDTEELLKHRSLKFRKLGGFQEGIPIDPSLKANMKKKDEPIIQIENLEGEVEKMKQQILSAKGSTTMPPELGLKEMIEKLKRELDYEYDVAVEATGFKDKLVMIREEIAKAELQGQTLHPLQHKIDRLAGELEQALPTAPNYASLIYKQDILKEIMKAKNLGEQTKKAVLIKDEMNKRYKEIIDRPDVKAKIEALKAETEASGSPLDDKQKENIINLKKEIEFKLINALRSSGLDVEATGLKTEKLRKLASFPDIKTKIEELDLGIHKEIEAVVKSSPDLQRKIELLQTEVAKAGKTPNSETKNKIEALKQEVEQNLAAILASLPLASKYEKLKEEILQATESPGGLSETANNDGLNESSSKHGGSTGAGTERTYV
ncbi:Acetyl-CoA carboxylase, alpha subunit [Dillenia turbinata]|uniref:acetyl-CoA carboxytransferase n=1 Tax=Dillenia turbinata TaxID=194707 RepID=A0AAN8ZMC5_9MAGN